MDITLGDVSGNLARVLQKLETAAANGANLVVFPEACLSGYCFSSLNESLPYHRTVDSAEIHDEFSQACARLGVTGVLGFLEGVRSATGGEFEFAYNSAAIAWQSSDNKTAVRDVYRKTHLPTLGVDRFIRQGPELGRTFDAPWGKLGTLICYDIRFPEAARVLGLNGVDVLALPTNWPEGAESSPDIITRARAWENRYWIVAANRVGIERGRRFIGRSQIVSPVGKVICEAGADEEVILYAELDLNIARQKRIINEPGEWELDITADRRPELYTRLTAHN
jgi:predicted amidohydrolase